MTPNPSNPAAPKAGAVARPRTLAGLLSPRRPDGSFDGMRIVSGIALVIAFISLISWLSSPHGEFWPVWAWLGMGIVVGIYYVVERVLKAPPGEQFYEFHRGFTVFILAICLFTWLFSGQGYFWPIWPLVVFGVLFLIHYLLHDQTREQREQVLTERVEVLTETRRGALDVQAAELRRIERDLHDGAQARLVSLSMQLGRAEQRLGAEGDEQTRALLKGAQEDARLAIAELRDLSRGIAPPVLTDRGLAAAAESLGKRSPLEVEVVAEIAERPAPVVESAAYFVIAESLTNAAKHSPGASVKVTLVGDHEQLRIVVADDGVGGADPSGSGLSGLRQRATALDGTLTIFSPRGQGTTITAELPCGL